MRDTVQETRKADGRVFGGASSRKRRITASLEASNATELADLRRLCYNDTPCGNLERKTFRSLLAKTLRQSKIAAKGLKYQHGTAFAISDARTVQSFRIRASLLMKGGHAIQGLSAARRSRG